MIKVLVFGHMYTEPIHREKFQYITRSGKFDITVVAPALWRHTLADYEFKPQTPEEKFKVIPSKISFSGNYFKFFYHGISRLLKEYHPDIIEIDEEPAFRACYSIIRKARRILPFIAVPCDKRALDCDRRLFKHYNIMGQHLSHDYPTGKEISDILHRGGNDFIVAGNKNVYLHYFLMVMERRFILRHTLTIIVNLIRWDKTKLNQLSPKARFVRRVLSPLRYIGKVFNIGPTYRKIFIVEMK